MRLLLDRLPSPIGNLFIVFDDTNSLRAIDYDDYEPRMRRLLQRHYGDPLLVAADAPGSITQALSAYFDGDLAAIDQVPVATNGSTFQRRVWSALRTISAGTTNSYGAFAAAIGAPAASRAVGLANGANPVAIVVPCHRLIGASGALTGYGGGLERKRWLLSHEGSPAA
jgi:O-6-methylguanine DNA methyltransferase